MAKAQTVTVKVDPGDLKPGAELGEPERFLNQPLLIPGIAASVGIVREAASKRGKLELEVELGSGLAPATEPADAPEEEG